MWRVGAVVMVCVVGAGCVADDADRTRQEFQSLVDDAATCTPQTRCALVAPGCPFDCAVAVQQGRADEVREASQSLRRQLELAAGTCEPVTMTCPEPSTLRAICLEGRCAVDTFRAALARVQAVADANRTCAVDLDCRAVETQCAEHDVCWLPVAAQAAVALGASVDRELHAAGFCPARERCEGIAQPFCDEARRCQVRVLEF